MVARSTMTSLWRSVSSTDWLCVSELNKLVLDGLEEDQAEALGKILEESNRLVGIVVDDTLIRDDYMERICEAAFRNPRVKTLTFLRTAISDLSRIPRWVSTTAPNLETMEFIDIRANASNTNIILQVLQSCRSLKKIDLTETRNADTIVEAVIQYLRSSTSLKELTIEECDITCRTMTTRNLGEALCRNMSLVALRVTNQYPTFDSDTIYEFSDESFAHAIETHSSLQTLIINVQKMRVSAADRLLNAVAVNKSLKKVVLAGIVLDNEGCLAAARLVRESNTIEDLTLINGQYSHDMRERGNVEDTENNGIVPFFRALARNQSLKSIQLDRWGSLAEEGVDGLCNGLMGNNTLESLKLQRISFGLTLMSRRRRFADFLSGNNSLTYLDLSHCKLDDDDTVVICKGLEHNTTLKSLELGSNEIGDKGVTAVAALIAGNAQLTKVSISDHCGGDKSIVQIGNALKTNTTLKSLDVYTRTSLGETCARALLDGVKEHPTLTDVRAAHGFSESQTQELWYYLELNKGARHALMAPLNLCPLVLARADRCRKWWHNPPSMLYFFVKEKCELFNVSTRETKETLESAGEPMTTGCKRDRSECESKSPQKRTKAV